MSPLPTEFHDRWMNRAEPATGLGTVYWHVLMSRYEGARLAAQDAQALLSQVDGFHLTPPEWLHMTTYLVGPAERYDRQQLAGMIATAKRELASASPIEVRISRILYHPEAVMLAIDPAQELQQLRTAAAVASGTEATKSGPSWAPHMTVGYSTTNRSAEPIVRLLGLSVASRTATIDRLTLVIQWGPERTWNWESVGEIVLSNTRSIPN
jgi:2'-5' RNA ligase